MAKGSKATGKIGKLISLITAGAYAMSTGAPASAATKPDIEELPVTENFDLWSTVQRISQDPSMALRIELAQQAGQSELAAAIVQSVRTCAGAVEDCVRQAITNAGELSPTNLISLASLSQALEAIGISSDTISEALDAYSTVVAEAVIEGRLSEQFAAITLSDEATGSLYL